MAIKNCNWKSKTKWMFIMGQIIYKCLWLPEDIMDDLMLIPSILDDLIVDDYTVVFWMIQNYDGSLRAHYSLVSLSPSVKPLGHLPWVISLRFWWGMSRVCSSPRVRDFWSEMIRNWIFLKSWGYPKSSSRRGWWLTIETHSDFKNSPG